MRPLPKEKNRTGRLENFALFVIVFALILGVMTLLQVQRAAPYIIVNICLLLASRAMLKSDYGVDIFRPSETRPGRQLLLGAAYGTLIFLQVFLLTLLITELLSIPLRLFPWLAADAAIEHIVLSLGLNLLMRCAASYAEEAFWRQYCWRALEDAGLPRVAVLLVITLIFALGHKPRISWISVVLIGLTGIGLGLLRMKYGEGSFLLTGSAHFVFNLLELFIM